MKKNKGTLSIIKKMISDGCVTQDVVEKYFPELAESEDERIRKELLNAFQESEDSIYIVLTPHRRKSFIAWLEKQGEQEFTPIFRIGDTIIAKDGTYIEKEPFHIDMIEDDCYWDGENTILVCNQDEFELFKQKPVEWSENDEKCLKNILWRLDGNVLGAEYMDRCKQWLESIKDRFNLTYK